MKVQGTDFYYWRRELLNRYEHSHSSQYCGREQNRSCHACPQLSILSQQNLWVYEQEENSPLGLQGQEPLPLQSSESCCLIMKKPCSKPAPSNSLTHVVSKRQVSFFEMLCIYLREREWEMGRESEEKKKHEWWEGQREKEKPTTLLSRELDCLM